MKPNVALYQQTLKELATQRADTKWGFFGPHTMVWQVNRERINYLGGLRAILMQLAHPAVAQGVADHSKFQHDPIGRFVRTMSVVQDILFGPADVAVKAATRVYMKHARVRGILSGGFTQSKDAPSLSNSREHREYYALDPELLLWVYATLIDSLMFIHDEILPPFGEEKWARLYEEGKPFAYLFGIPEEVLPVTLDEFRTYVQGMVASLEVSTIALEMGWKVIRSPHPVFGVSNTVLSAGTLPARLREAFGLPWNWTVQAGYRVGMRFLRVAVPRLPNRIRTHTVRKIGSENERCVKAQ